MHWFFFYLQKIFKLYIEENIDNWLLSKKNRKYYVKNRLKLVKL